MCTPLALYSERLYCTLVYIVCNVEMCSRTYDLYLKVFLSDLQNNFEIELNVINLKPRIAEFVED